MSTSRSRKPKAPIEVDSIRHKETRANIPTEELRDFVARDEESPKTVLYPRDPSLDPQLVWKGKDEQDSQPLEVANVPIYIQEKIHPQALIDDLRKNSAQPETAQLDFFADFNGMSGEFAQKVEFYQHQQHWSNRMILGDSLLVMTSLSEKEGLKGKVQTIYIDPPYGIKFGSNWQVSTRKRDVKDGSAADATRQPEQVKAFRDTWKLGIHSYLSYLRDRFMTSRELLSETGSIFVQMSDENLHLVRNILDEVLGPENFVSLITFATTSGFETNELARGGDFLLWYARNKSQIKVRALFEETPKPLGTSGYKWLRLSDGIMRSATAGELRQEQALPEGAEVYKPDNILSSGGSSSPQPFVVNGITYSPSSNNHWKAQYPAGMERLLLADRIHTSRNSIQYVRLARDFELKSRNSIWTDTLTGQFTEEKIYAVQTNTKIAERCILMTTDPGDLVLDPTCGSGTTAYVAEQWGRRWITIDTSRVALALARTRLMAAKYPFYLLADSPAGIAKEQELTGKVAPPYRTDEDIRKGFVYKRVPHITLKSIANNPDIREGMTREEIDAAIARHAEFETLYDQPYEDNKRVRVSGPFTVESLSPHRVLSTADNDWDGDVFPEEEARQGDFVTMILDNLRKAGVQNTVKGEKLTFARLDPFAGKRIDAVGEYQDQAGEVKRVAVAIGPEHGTVSPQFLKEAAIEAVRGVGFDILVVCGFAFDPHVSEEATRYGNLTVLVTRMNPDLAMGDELLKKTGAGNLFMVFGEPDVEINRTPDGEIEVSIHGVDVYDPTTGVIRPSSTDDIACWFIDTNYDDASFFVRHAYFTGAGDPYDRLKRALRAEIDEDAWSTLYRTTSRPFPPPETGKIAVKVINHYGDEVLKVYEV
ncbi:MAG: site-specific DNA-methyltransferase [Thermomicrobiales bacterium]|nr:site-specific DNA-methyltransferase [Thermomicrobiales bacterium]